MTAERLTMAEEVLLLALDDATGEFLDLPPGALGVAFGGAIIMELALLDRIDTDLQKLFVISTEPTGDVLLDEVLAEIAAQPAAADGADAEPETEQWSTRLWVEELASREDDYRERLLHRLVARGVLRLEDTRMLWMFGNRAYPPTTGIEEREVRARLLAGVFGQEIPETHDILLIGLLNATGIFAHLLAPEALEAARARIDQLTTMEEISRSVGRAVYDAQIVIMSRLWV